MRKIVQFFLCFTTCSVPFQILFLRDGTSRCPYVPGQKKNLCESKCPVTTPLSRDVPGQNDLKSFKKRDQISWFRTLLECLFLLCPVLSRVPSRILAVPVRPIPDFGCPSPSSHLTRFLACHVVPLSRDNDGTSVPLSRKVALFLLETLTHHFYSILLDREDLYTMPLVRLNIEEITFFLLGGDGHTGVQSPGP